MRIIVAILISIVSVLVYLNLIGVIFNGSFSFGGGYVYEEFDLPETSSLSSVKIAFFGDQGIGTESKRVLELVKEKEVDLIVLLGDFDYSDSPEKFKEMYKSVYGNESPLLAVVGNHDVLKWDEYKSWMESLQVPGLNCAGEYGEVMVCNFGPVSITLSAIGTLPGEHMKFLENTLPRVDNSWKICAWHKNHKGYQAGGKGTEVDMEAYRLCAENDALIMTGHEHSYSRSYGIGKISEFEVNDRESPFDINKSSIVVVSGLGGKSVRDVSDDIKDIWGNIYSKEDDAKAGALICEFTNTSADCEFINTDREVIDKFKVVN